MQNPQEDAEKLLHEVKEKRSTKEMEDYLMRRLSASQSKNLSEILKNPAALEQMLNTPEAKALFKKFVEGKEHG